MTWSYFIHVHGDVARRHSVAKSAIQELNLFAREWSADAVVVLHEPFAVQGSDPLPVAQDARLLLGQLLFHELAALSSASGRIERALATLASEAGVRDVQSQVMTTEWLLPGSPDDRKAPGEAVSFFVQYDGPADDPGAFHSYYRSHHVPIVFRMPRIRSVSYHLPTGIKPPTIGRAVERLQLVQAVFDTAEEFLTMRKSAERKEGLRDFKNYPRFDGDVTHQIMRSRRLK